MRTWFWIRWLLIFRCASTAQRNFHIILDNVTTRIFDSGTIEKLGCQVQQINNRSYVNCQMLLNREIVKMDVRTVLDFKKPNGQAMKLYDARVDACLLMGSYHKNRFLNIYSNNFKKSNMRCPLKANFNYTQEGMYLDEQEFPTFVPSGTFRCLCNFYLNETFIISRVVTHGKVTPSL
ncbi:uncharacterized protein [Drosophila takahashii]|uniref:uncharacterized protein n=1 Tax=Drosophila takahashii TaxID=29030 RepID=UPI001CF8D824|nr:uncharacterized protein LOC108058202 [Drosophila takahashii]